jgi:hypothetical protein
VLTPEAQPTFFRKKPFGKNVEGLSDFRDDGYGRIAMFEPHGPLH